MSTTDIFLMTAAFGLAIFGLGVWDQQRRTRGDQKQLKLNYPKPSKEHKESGEEKHAATV